jgi:predicted aspartyl protease
LCCWFVTASAQYFSIGDGSKRITFPFKIIRNLVVVKVSINNAGPYNFVLDTGVGLMVITDPSLVDSINIPNKRTIKVSGFGDGEAYEAFVTTPLNVNVSGIVSHNVSAAIFKKDHFGLSQYAGVSIHGLLGHAFFSQLAVKVNFTDSLITVTKPENMRRFKTGSRVPITIEDNKPYFKTPITLSNGRQQVTKFIIDLGAGHAISLEKVADKTLYSQQLINANLGIGLNGLISGYKGRVKEIQLGKYKIKNVLTSYPDDNGRVSIVPRDGNLGVEVLKRFTIVFNYSGNEMYIKSNVQLKAPYDHDMSGLQYYAAGKGYKHIIIERVEPGSPGDEAGICEDDEITAINFKPVADMTLEEIDQLFKSRHNRSLLLSLYRNETTESVILTLRRRI